MDIMMASGDLEEILTSSKTDERCVGG
jgi:hypothetical protein